MGALINQSWFYQTAFYVAIAVCFLPEWYGSAFKRSEKGAVSRDRGSHWWLLIVIGAGIFVAIFLLNANLPGTTITWYQPVVFWIGIALMVAGQVFRWNAIRVLGKFFTFNVATRAGQYVVDTGPYRSIRHPGYAGSLLAFFGLGLAMTNWASLVAVMLGIGIGYAYRVRIEERALCADLGQPYRDYMRRTRRFVPYVW
ncbi:MAG TPA: isoprenylcysteine carboxylmethyltransferase family protein [Rhodanobacteraceae bacterium]